MPSVSATTATTSSGVAPTTGSSSVDYRYLLLRPEDMVLPNSGYSVMREAEMNPGGVAGAEEMIISDDATNAVGITIVLLSDASAAAGQLPIAIANLSTVTATVPPLPAPLGDGAQTLSGTTPDGTKSAVALMFRQGRAIARIDFYSLLGQPTSMSAVLDVGQKQNVALRVGLGSIGPPS